MLQLIFILCKQPQTVMSSTKGQGAGWMQRIWYREEWQPEWEAQRRKGPSSGSRPPKEHWPSIQLLWSSCCPFSLLTGADRQKLPKREGWWYGLIGGFRWNGFIGTVGMHLVPHWTWVLIKMTFGKGYRSMLWFALGHLHMRWGGYLNGLTENCSSASLFVHVLFAGPGQ